MLPGSGLIDYQMSRICSYYLQISCISSYNLQMSQTSSYNLQMSRISSYCLHINHTSSTTSAWAKRAQQGICELSSSRTYMWATEFNALYVSYQAQRPMYELPRSTTQIECNERCEPRPPLAMQVWMDSWMACIVPFPYIAVCSHWVFSHRGF